MMTILFISRWPSFLIALACWRLGNCSPILVRERLFFGHVFTYPWSPWGWQASNNWSLLDAHLELALHFFILHHDDVLKVLIKAHFILSSRHTCHRLNSYLTNIWITPWTSWSSLDLLHYLPFHYGDVLKVYMRYHSILFFKTYFL